jgi:hypothetical protein
VLLSTSFLRAAFLSPGAGGLPVGASRLFLLSRRVPPVRADAGAALAFFLGGSLARADEVEKAARWTALREGEDVAADDSRERYERERHREQKDCDIAAVGFLYFVLGKSTTTGALANSRVMLGFHLQFPSRAGVFSFARAPCPNRAC